jgi:hypothetical protein
MKLKPIQSFDHVLESVIILSWADLMKNAGSGLLHLEYTFSADNSLNSLKLWSSTVRGHWYLVCDYWMSDSADHGKGIYFQNGFRSDRLGNVLEFVMQHQRAFSRSPNLGRNGLLQIQPPTEIASKEAASSVREAYCCVNAFSAEPCLA